MRDPHSYQMEKLIVRPLESADVPAVIVIDALDELVDETSQSDLLSLLERWSNEIPKVKFLVTSRPKPLFLTGRADIFVLHDIASDLVNNDIRLFLKHELSGLASRNGLDNWPTAAQLDLLCTRAAGLFVYAVATVKFLGRKHTSPSEQYAIIARSPDDTIHEGTIEGVHGGLSLDSLCTSIFQTCFREYLAQTYGTVRSVLATLALVTHPLPPSAIAALIYLDLRVVMCIFGSIKSLLMFHGDPDQPIRLLHKLLPDLLTSPTRCADKNFYISPGKFHSEIALGCLKLMNETLEGSLPPRNHTMGSDIKSPLGNTALEYACTSWHIHLAQAREDITVLTPTLRRFLEGKIEAWTQALAVLGAETVAASAGDETISWLREVSFGWFQNVLEHLRTPNQVAKNKWLLNVAEQRLPSTKSPSVNHPPPLITCGVL
jgi:hypothetical protein